MRTLVTGATGFVGRRLISRLQQPVVLSRNAARAKEQLQTPGLTAWDWDIARDPAPKEAFENVRAVVHLAGETISEGRWTAAKRARIRDSRVLGTRRLLEGIEQAAVRPEVLVSASAIGIYGSQGDAVLDESSPTGDDFLAEVCHAWEQEARLAEKLGVRVVNVRIGLVLGRGGGALGAMRPLFRWGLGGRMGLTGKQWWSWIHIDDLVGLMLFASERPDLSGPLNGTSPNPVTNRQFTADFARAIRRPAFFHAPGPMLRLALDGFGGVLLASQRVVPKRALEAGFHFQFPDLTAALADLTGN